MDERTHVNVNQIIINNEVLKRTSWINFEIDRKSLAISGIRKYSIPYRMLWLDRQIMFRWYFNELKIMVITFFEETQYLCISDCCYESTALCPICQEQIKSSDHREFQTFLAMWYWKKTLQAPYHYDIHQSTFINGKRINTKWNQLSDFCIERFR